jgi:hypothetical protein
MCPRCGWARGLHLPPHSHPICPYAQRRWKGLQVSPPNESYAAVRNKPTNDFGHKMKTGFILEKMNFYMSA